MPYNYHYDMATSKAKVIFKLLFRWRGSVWRAVYVEYLFWLAAYGILSCIYRFALTKEQQGQFIITPTAANYTVVDLYFPFMSSLEFIFYVGWMKVAMELLNPFGEDDDDFDCNFLLDRNLTVCLFHKDP
ncbi:hypothetical protein NECAME_09099 [Necator americanus]|uniref:Bestrophin homolog n=1 Tax=Necator americanus TaxID=51031 RepID=W2TH51_NECAM|nr:hypothetical protein NECAME_09099 [Necator americanus]ETN80516.1 hypothetical protein NECAME_09099 [Necator americanus]